MQPLGLRFNTSEWQLMRCKHFEATPNIDLTWRVKQVPGLEDKMWCLSSPVQNPPVVSWAQLGAMSGDQWQEVLLNMPKKELEGGRSHLWNPRLLGPGHLNSFDRLRMAARADCEDFVRMKKLIEKINWVRMKKLSEMKGRVAGAMSGDEKITWVRVKQLIEKINRRQGKGKSKDARRARAGSLKHS